VRKALTGFVMAALLLALPACGGAENAEVAVEGTDPGAATVPEQGSGVGPAGSETPPHASPPTDEPGPPTASPDDTAPTGAETGPPAEPKHGDRWRNPLGIEFVYIRPGAFTMGSPGDEPYRQDDETQHRVVLSKGFWLGVTEITQKQWNDLMGPNFCYFEGDNVPIESVTWHDAMTFCRRLSKKEHHTYRLPTEAEWEYACRAGTTTAFHYGDHITTKQVNFDGRVYFYGTETEGTFLFRVVPVKSYPPNPWGLYDMHGNVGEWCADWYGPYPSGEVTDPKGPQEGKSRVIRGGCWQSYQRDLRCARRLAHDPTMMHYTYGFRVVMEP